MSQSLEIRRCTSPSNPWWKGKEGEDIIVVVVHRKGHLTEQEDPASSAISW